VKLKSLFVTLVVLGTVSALAQEPSTRPPSSGVPFDFNLGQQAALFSDWWNDPKIANELRLTDQQEKALEQMSTNVKLTLIDAGASGLKSYVRLQSLLDSDPFDRNAFNQELDTASAAVSRLVKDVGDMALTVRTTLTTEQWRKLETMKASRRTNLPPHSEPRGDAKPDRPHSTPAPARQ
jgi:Spy/CpxP family protein refolding chaperone